MSVQKVTICDRCGKIIQPREGVSVLGNIYIVGGGGLVGDNIVVDEDERIDGIKTSDYHFDCLQEVLRV